MRTLDPGTMGGDTGPFGFLLGMLAVTLVGIFVISALIGIINTGSRASSPSCARAARGSSSPATP